MNAAPALLLLLGLCIYTMSLGDTLNICERTSALVKLDGVTVGSELATHYLKGAVRPVLVFQGERDSSLSSPQYEVSKLGQGASGAKGVYRVRPRNLNENAFSRKIFATEAERDAEIAAMSILKEAVETVGKSGRLQVATVSIDGSCPNASRFEDLPGQALNKFSKGSSDAEKVELLRQFSEGAKEIYQSAKQKLPRDRFTVSPLKPLVPMGGEPEGYGFMITDQESNEMHFYLLKWDNVIVQNDPEHPDRYRMTLIDPF